LAELGSIYEEETRQGTRGRDLRAEVHYPARALGDSDGVWVDVARLLSVDGEQVARTPSSFDREGKILLRLPEDFPAGGALRLRGQGETPAGGGPAGDLFVQVTIDGARKRRPKLPKLRTDYSALATPDAGPSAVMIAAVTLGGGLALYWLASTI